MRTLEQAIDIEASPEQVFEAITTTDRVRSWAQAFGPEMSVDAEWREGGEIVWEESGGRNSIRGTITTFEPGRLLVLSYPMDPSSQSPARNGAFDETFSIVSEQGFTKLVLASGPLNDEDYAVLDPLWRNALDAIRDEAEGRSPAGTASRSPDQSASTGAP